MWTESLRRVCAVHLGEPERWGTLDCCQFVREYVRDLAGVDYGAEFDYTDEATAMALIAAHGTLVDLLASLLGPPKPEPEEGDVVVTQMGAGSYGAGVFAGPWVIGVYPGRGVCRYEAPIVAAWSCHK